MPERLSTRTFDASSVQGEGAILVLRGATVGEVLGNRRAAEARNTARYRFGRWLGRLFRRAPSPVDQMRDNMRYYAGHVRSWNWVGDDGEPLPLPADDPSVIERLTTDEMAFIIACVNGERQTEEQKN